MSSPDIAREFIDDAGKRLRKSAVVSRLGVESARKLLGIHDKLYAADTKDTGSHQLVDVKSDGIPVVALGTGEIAVFGGDNTKFSSEQRESLDRDQIPAATQDKMEASLPPIGAVHIDARMGGKVAARDGVYEYRPKGLLLPKKQELLVRGRPLLAINADMDPSHPGQDGAFLHEMVHVHQVLDRPSTDIRAYTKVQTELEAYLAEARIDTATHGRHLDRLTKAQQVQQAYDEWLASGHTLRTPVDFWNFEQLLRDRKIGMTDERKLHSPNQKLK